MSTTTGKKVINKDKTLVCTSLYSVKNNNASCKWYFLITNTTGKMKYFLVSGTGKAIKLGSCDIHPKSANRPFSSCGLCFLAFEWTWGWGDLVLIQTSAFGTSTLISNMRFASSSSDFWKQFNALFSYLPIEIVKLKPREIFSLQNREIYYPRVNSISPKGKFTFEYISNFKRTEKYYPGKGGSVFKYEEILRKKFSDVRDRSRLWRDRERPRTSENQATARLSVFQKPVYYQSNLRSGPIWAVLIHSLRRLFVSSCPPECNFQSETKIEPDLRLYQSCC